MVTGKWVYPYRSWTPLPEDETIVGELLDHPPYARCEEIGATEAEIRHARALYAGEVTLVDTWVGRLLEKIDYCCPDDTAVIFHSDHGFNVGDHGRFGKSLQAGDDPLDWPYYDEVSHAALMIRLPGAAEKRRRAGAQDSWRSRWT
jgi:arylsulfatase A-like enzyme